MDLKNEKIEYADLEGFAVIYYVIVKKFSVFFKESGEEILGFELASEAIEYGHNKPVKERLED